MRKKFRKRGNLTPVYHIIYELGGLFGRECEVCGRKMRKPMSGFTIHHLVYKEGEKTFRDFSSRLKYYKYLKPLIYGRAEFGLHHREFAFLCNACHHSIDGPRGLKRRKPLNVLRLFLLWYRTNT